MNVLTRRIRVPWLAMTAACGMSVLLLASAGYSLYAMPAGWVNLTLLALGLVQATALTFARQFVFGLASVELFFLAWLPFGLVYPVDGNKGFALPDPLVGCLLVVVPTTLLALSRLCLAEAWSDEPKGFGRAPRAATD